MRLCVGFGPQADLSGLLERVVLYVEIRFAVELALDVVALVDNAQRVPAGGGLQVGGGQLSAFAARDLVDAVIILQRIHSGKVVVVVVLVAPDEAAPLVDLAGDGLEGHGKVEVAEAVSCRRRRD